MKILLIGNSHSAALKKGFDVLAPQCPGLSLTVYPHYHRYFGQFAVDEEAGCIRMTHPKIRARFIKLHGGDGSIRPLDYDICMIVGGMMLWQGLALGHYSTAFERAVVDDHVESLHPLVLLRKIRVVSDIPVLVVCNPFPACRNGMQPDAQAGHGNERALINSVIGPRYEAQLVIQPPETLLHARQTRLEFAVGERIWGDWTNSNVEPFLFDDLLHMNAAYGTLMMRQILRGLGQQIGDVEMPPAEGHLPLAEKTTGPP